MWALRLNSSGGGKTRFSRRVESRSWLEMDAEFKPAGTCVEDMKESSGNKKVRASR